jgi:hypothetical protein
MPQDCRTRQGSMRTSAIWLSCASGSSRLLTGARIASNVDFFPARTSSCRGTPEPLIRGDSIVVDGGNAGALKKERLKRIR